ncbi:hypothetical protein ACFQ07_10315 [Actinomadura adrarensis]|uniref:Uncharacterized protein n=1 Tax=Actinomadura adrarensis TaxID=1819600 RepID=A0ABW3CDU0_9ACTN
MSRNSLHARRGDVPAGRHPVRTALVEEGQRLLAAAHPEADDREVIV